MIKKLTVTILVLLFSSSLYAEFQMERVICTTKKISNNKEQQQSKKTLKPSESVEN